MGANLTQTLPVRPPARPCRFQNHRYKTKRATSHDKRGSISVGSELNQGLYHSHHGAGDHTAMAAAAALKQAQQQQQSNHHTHQAAVSAHHEFLATMAAAQRNQAAAAAPLLAALNANGGAMIGDHVGQSHHNPVAPGSVGVVPSPMMMHDKHWSQPPY